MKFLKRFAKWTAVVVVVVAIAAVARGCHAFRDRTPNYSLDVKIKPGSAPKALRAGFGRVAINPNLSNTNAPVWLAGFSHNRAATGIHDDLEATACVVDDGNTRVGIVALDAIGFFHDDVIRVRERCARKLQLNYVVVCSTHDHSAPDLMGLWGPSYTKTGVSADYREQVIAGAVKALEQAVANLSLARLRSFNIKAPTEGLVADTRQPQVFDPDIRLMAFTDPGTGRMLGSIVGWANHPETVWSRNTEVTADYCGYLRKALESGVYDGNRELAPGVGGIHVYLNGAVGGLISTTPGVTVRDPFLGQDFKEPSHEKARAVGHKVAALVLPALRDTNAPAATQVSIGVRAGTFLVPLDNRLYLLACYLGLMDRGQAGWMKLRTETALITIGDVSLACVPGEIYPEIVNGGVENPEGADFRIAPQEVPPIRDMMPGRVKFIIGLANDELGYMVPKSQWDSKAPFTYGRKSAPYGEINSCGPQTGYLVWAHLAEMIRNQ